MRVDLNADMAAVMGRLSWYWYFNYYTAQGMDTLNAGMMASFKQHRVAEKFWHGSAV